MRNYFAIFRKIIIFASWYSAICWICSHTLRGCVDWNSHYLPNKQTLMSHPSWVCGLKLVVLRCSGLAVGVTPFVGVWIETQQVRLSQKPLVGHTLRGCVDWNILSILMILVQRSHTLRGCVDWNLRDANNKCPAVCHTLRGCVDWNHIINAEEQQELCHTLRGCVDWNKSIREKAYEKAVTPFVGVWIETQNIL